MTDPPAPTAIDISTRPDHHGLGVKHPVNPSKKRGLLRWLVRLIVVVVLLVVIVIAVAPKLLSTKTGTSMLVDAINARIDGTLAINDLQLSWGKGQFIDGLTYVDPAKGMTATTQAIEAGDLSLFSLVTGQRRLGNVRVFATELVYEQNEGAGDSVKPEDDQGPGLNDQPITLPRDLSGTLVIDTLVARYAPPDQEAVVLTLPAGTLDMPNLRDITFDFDAALNQGEKAGQVRLTGELLNLFDPGGVLQLSQARYDGVAHVKGLPINALDRFLVDTPSLGLAGLLKEAGRLTAVLGDGDLTASVIMVGTLSDLKTELHANSPNLRVDLFQERDGQTLIAAPNSSARLTLAQEGFAALFPETDLTLVETTGIELGSLNFRLPTDDAGIDWQTATAAVLVKADANLALKDKKGEVIGIDALRLEGGAESIAEQLTFALSASLSAVDAKGSVTREPIKAELTIKKPMRAEREILLQSQALPIRLADELAGQDGKLVLWLGKELGMQAQLQARKVTDAQGVARLERTFTLKPDGRVAGEVTGAIAAGRYTFATPKDKPIKAVLVPEAFASLMEMLSGKPGKPALTIDQPMPVFVSLRQAEKGEVSIATDPTKKGVKRFYPDPDRTYVGATIQLSPARVYDPVQDKTYDLRGGLLTLKADDLRGKVDLAAELDLWVRPDAGREGVAALLTWQTTVADLLDAGGAVPLDGKTLMQQIAIDGGVTLENAPSGLFDSLLKRNGDIAAVLGPIVQQMDARFTYADGQPTGASVRLNWDEQNNQPIPGAWASMKPVAFDIDKDQMLTVRGGEDVELEVRVTEDFGNRWMGQLHPILFDARSGDRPVRVKIDGKSFKFPFSDPAMKGADVQAVVDLGSVEFGPGALLGQLMQWSRHPGERAVFEPANVTLKDGNISYDQFQLTVGNVRLGMQGQVNLVSGQIVDMAMLVPGESLIRVFGELDGLIKPEDTLSLPMTGEIRKPQFDSKLIAREVARMIAEGALKQQRDKLKDTLRDKVRDELKLGDQLPADEIIDDAFGLIFGRKRTAPKEDEKPKEQPNE